MNKVKIYLPKRLKGNIKIVWVSDEIYSDMTMKGCSAGGDEDMTQEEFDKLMAAQPKRKNK